MKKTKIFIILTCFMAIFSNFKLPISQASEKAKYYAKIEKENIFFYENPIENQESKLFIIPQSYFVLLSDETENGFYVAQYKDIYGYVKKEEVSVMIGTPKNPYADLNFTVFDFDGLDMFSDAKFTDNTPLTKIPYQTVIETFYGEIDGENIPNMNKSWYYCKYTKNQTDIYGYVYSAFCYNETTINVNTESFEIIENPKFEITKTGDEKLSEVAMAFIIIGVSLPCIVIIYLLIKPSMQKELNTSSKNKKIIRKRNKDYFEFDENDLN